MPLDDSARQRPFPALLLAVLLLLAPGCKRSFSCGSSTDTDLVACVDGTPVSRAFAQQFVEESWWIPGSPDRPDPRKAALDRATRTLLFANEAHRRNFALVPGTPDAPASWSQAFIAAEMAHRGLDREQISIDEAQRYYDENKELFNQLDRVETLVLVSPSAADAARLYPEAVAASDEGFKALVAKHSTDEATREKGGARSILASTDEDRELLKMALSLRKPGSTGGPFQGADKRWYLLRVVSSPIEHPRPFDEKLIITVKNVLRDQKRRALIEELDKTLRAKASIQLPDKAIEKLKAP